MEVLNSSDNIYVEKEISEIIVKMGENFIMKKGILLIVTIVFFVLLGMKIQVQSEEITEVAYGEEVVGGRTVPYYNLGSDGGLWDGKYYKRNGKTIKDAFFCDGTYTYYLQADGTPMKNKLTYHPNGVDLIYFDEKGHELFDEFRYCKNVGYTCYFNTYGYLYKNEITFSNGKTYYLDGTGRMKQSEWFKFYNGVDIGYTNADGSLMNNGFGYDPWGRVVFYHWNGMVARGLISDGVWYYHMDETDGHLLGRFSETNDGCLTMTAGERSLENLLATAKEPVGRTMYVWGGGWNDEDTGAGIEATSIGISPRWEAFAREQNRWYDYNNTRYQIHDGLDCSGYVGWVIYNVFETKSGEKGYVMKATQMANTFSSYGWGEYIPAERVTEWKAGDIMSMKGHVWISLGMCEDGSVVLMHSSPPGVRICGTELSNGGDSQAIQLAKEYMKRNYPEWYQRYPECKVKFSYLQSSSQMRWNEGTLSDDMKIQEMGAGQVLKLLYP